MKSTYSRFAFWMVMASAGTILLSGCAGGGAQAGASAPLPPVDSAGRVAAPLGTGGVENRLAALEVEVQALRRDYNNLLPAFTSLNTTSERIGALLEQAEKEQGTRAVTIVPVQHAPQASVPQATIPYVAQAARVEDPVVASTVVSRATATASRAAAPAASTTQIQAENLHFADQAPLNVVPGAAARSARAPAAPATAAPTSTSTSTPPALASVARSQTVVNPQPQANAVRGLRIGEHGHRTRLVLDLAGSVKPDIRYEIDNTERFMLLEMPGLPWGGVRSGVQAHSAFVEGWSVENTDGGGANLIISLKEKAKILSTEYIKGDGSRGARLVVDIGPAS